MSMPGTAPGGRSSTAPGPQPVFLRGPRPDSVAIAQSHPAVLRDVPVEHLDCGGLCGVWRAGLALPARLSPAPATQTRLAPRQPPPSCFLARRFAPSLASFFFFFFFFFFFVFFFFFFFVAFKFDPRRPRSPPPCSLLRAVIALSLLLCAPNGTHKTKKADMSENVIPRRGRRVPAAPRPAHTWAALPTYRRAAGR